MERLHIRELREAAGITQEALAVVQWESVKKNPQASKLPQMADLLNCTIDQLFGREAAS